MEKRDRGLLYHKITPVIALRLRLKIFRGHPFGEGERVSALQLWLGSWHPHDQALHRLGTSARDKCIEGVQELLFGRRGRYTCGIGGIMVNGEKEIGASSTITARRS